MKQNLREFVVLIAGEVFSSFYGNSLKEVFCFVLFFLTVLEIELTALCLLGKHSYYLSHSSSFFCF
jgi:uncharacterized integral membrane protein